MRITLAFLSFLLEKTIIQLAGLVESEKLRAMASRTALKAADKQKMADAQQMQVISKKGRNRKRLSDNN